jgi:hypothetical protein
MLDADYWKQAAGYNELAHGIRPKVSAPPLA